jgi:transcriptional activator SPT8
MPDNNSPPADQSFRITPTSLLLHPQTSVNCTTATSNWRWLFTGSDDGYIRKFDMQDTAAGKLMLTQNQRMPLTLTPGHGLVDSITRSGVLVSVWEAIDTQKTENSIPTAPDPFIPGERFISPIYSLAVHSQGVWILAGLESGAIMLYTVRHDEGYLVHKFNRYGLE